MRLIYCAGAFSAPTREGIDANIARAIDVGLEVAALGHMPIIPHANTGDPRFMAAQRHEFWIEGTLELMTRCDAVVLVPGHEESPGTRGEIAEARRLGIPVFNDVKTLAALVPAEERT